MIEVIIAAYDERWPAQFAAEAARLGTALGPLALAIEHVGSTSVPGLAAKPILDLMIGVADTAAARAPLEAALVALGYEALGEHGIPGRLYFHRGPPPPHRTHHLHVVDLDSAFWRDHLRFRDHLRAHPDVARDYEALKRGLAARFPDNRPAYTEGKSELIAAVLRQSALSPGRG